MFDRIKPFDKAHFDPTLNYLWVLHADKIPPHVGISTSGKYFSLKHNGKDEHLPIDRVIELVERKGIKTLAIRLLNNYSLSELEEAFSAFDTTFSNEITCLAPIEKLVIRPKFEKLEALLVDLESRGGLGEIIGINVDESYTGIPFYTEADIHKRLQFLENVKE